MSPFGFVNYFHVKQPDFEKKIRLLYAKVHEKNRKIRLYKKFNNFKVDQDVFFQKIVLELDS